MATNQKRGTNVDATNGSTWASTSNAVDGSYGVNSATYATWTSSTANATGYIDIGGFDFSALPDSATINSVTIYVRHFESNTTRISAVTFRPWSGGAGLGSGSFTCTRDTTARTDSTATFTPTVAQLKADTFFVRVNCAHNNSTQSGIFNVDFADVSVDYTSSNTASGTHSYTSTATGQILRNNTFNGTDGVTVSTSNAPSDGSENFDVIDRQNTAVLEYDTAQRFSGSAGLHVQVSSGADHSAVRWNIPSSTVHTSKFYYYQTARSTTNTFWVTRASGSQRILGVGMNSSGNVTATDAAGTITTSTGTTLSNNTWYRFEVTLSTTGGGGGHGSYTLNVYEGQNTSAYITLSPSSPVLDTNGTGIVHVLFGKYTSSTDEFWMDSIATKWWEQVEFGPEDRPSGTASGSYASAAGTTTGDRPPNHGTSTTTYAYAKGTVTGIKPSKGTSTTTYTYAKGTVTGSAPSVAKTGTATGSYVYAKGTVTGKEPAGGTASTTFSFAPGTRTGYRLPKATSTTTYTYAKGTVTGKEPAKGTTTTTYTFAKGTVTGKEPAKGTSTTTYTFAKGTVTGDRPANHGTATTTYTFAKGTVTGKEPAKGSTSTTYTFAAGTTTGDRPPNHGTATGSYTEAKGTVTGKRPPKASANGNFSYGGAIAVGGSSQGGYAITTYNFAKGTVTGKRSPKATSTTTYTFAKGTVTGSKAQRGTSSTTYTFVKGSVTGKKPSKGTSGGSYVFAKGSVVGGIFQGGAASGAFLYAKGTVTGIRLPNHGTASGGFAEASSATGYVYMSGETFGVLYYEESFPFGVMLAKGQATGSWSFHVTTFGGSGAAGSASGSFHFFGTTSATGVVGVVWNGSDFVGCQIWNGVQWRTDAKVWTGSSWTPLMPV